MPKTFRAVLTGVPAFDAKLRRLAGPALNRITRSGLRAANNVTVQAMRAAAPTESIRQAIGGRMLKSKEGLGAKAGAGVGKKMGPKGEKPRVGRGTKGVGISARNIHWYVLGTQERETGSVLRRNKLQGKYRKSTGHAIHSTGKMPAHGFIAQAALASQGTARDTLRTAIRRGIEREYYKAGGE